MKRMRAPLMTLALMCTLHRSAPAVTRAQGPEVARVLSSLSPGVQLVGEAPLRWTVEDRMRHYGVPGVAIAVVRGGRIAWTYEAGVLAVDKPATVTSSTPFRAQSLAKPLTAFAALRLVEQQVLTLDAPLQAYLKSWTIPREASAGNGALTLRQTLSHRAGFSVWGVPKYARGSTLPTLLQALDGTPPAASTPVRVVTAPGSETRYSGGGYSVVQLLLEEARKQPFADVMRELVLEPVGMSASLFHSDVPPAMEGIAAVGHASNGRPLQDRWPSLVQLAAGGLLTTASDVARFVVTLIDAWHGRSSLLSRETARDMMTIQWEGWGLGLEVQGSGDETVFSHTGSGNGFRAVMMGIPARGDGAVILANGEQGSELRYEILRSLAVELNWHVYRPVSRARVALDPAAYASLAGEYVFTDGSTMQVAVRGAGLVVSWGSQPVIEIYSASPRVFFNRANEEYAFSEDGQSLTWKGGFGSFVARRRAPAG